MSLDLLPYELWQMPLDWASCLVGCKACTMQQLRRCLAGSGIWHDRWAKAFCIEAAGAKKSLSSDSGFLSSLKRYRKPFAAHGGEIVGLWPGLSSWEHWTWPISTTHALNVPCFVLDRFPQTHTAFQQTWLIYQLWTQRLPNDRTTEQRICFAGRRWVSAEP